MTHLEIANSSVMAMLCGFTILVVLLQPILFLILGVKRGHELNMTDAEMREAAVSSAVFSILPSLPIIISYLILVPSLGRYFPWLRLSVVGSASYETMAANMAAENFGLESITVPDIPADIFIGIVFVVTVSILGGNIFNLFFLKTYDKKVQVLKGKNAALHNHGHVPWALRHYGYALSYQCDQCHRLGCHTRCRRIGTHHRQDSTEGKGLKGVLPGPQHDSRHAAFLCGKSADVRRRQT